MATVYDYSFGRSVCAAKGMVWIEDIVPEVDKRFAELGLTQKQVDGCLQMYVHYLAWLFTPKTYRWYERASLAWHFLFGKGPS